MSKRLLARLFAAALLCACGPSETGTATDDDASATSHGSDAGEPVCVPRTDAELDWQSARDDPLPAAARDVAVAVDGAGRIVVATTDETESDGDVLVGQIQADGGTRWVLRYEGPAGLYEGVLGVAVDPDGSIYVAVNEQTRELVTEPGWGGRGQSALVVLAIGPDGEKRWRWIREFPEESYGTTSGAVDIAIAPSGDAVLVVDTRAAETPPSLLRLDRWGNELQRVDLSTDLTDVARLRIALTSDGATWISAARYGESRILRLDVDGGIEVDDTLTGEDVFATAIVAGRSGEAYVLRTTGDPEAGDAGFQVSRYEQDGTVAWTEAGAFSTGAGYPAGIAIDCDGSPIVAAELEAYPMRTAVLYGFDTSGAPTFQTQLGVGDNLAPRSIARAPDGALVLGGLQGTNDALGPWLGSVR